MAFKRFFNIIQRRKIQIQERREFLNEDV